MRIVIAEDSVLLREGLIRLLSEAGHEVVAGVDDAAALLRAVEETSPDMAIIDVRLPPAQTDEGIRAALGLHRARPSLALLILSQYVEETYAARLVISEGAVEKHISNVFSKLGLSDSGARHRRVLAVLAYLGRRPPGPG